jgi:hypothetical protein
MADSTYPMGWIPLDYLCGYCGAAGCKLWRPYHEFSPTLLCAGCVEREAGEPVDLAKGDQVSGFVPAVPTADNLAYWAYTAVPDDGVAWWKALPTRPAAREREAAVAPAAPPGPISPRMLRALVRVDQSAQAARDDGWAEFERRGQLPALERLGLVELDARRGRTKSESGWYHARLTEAGRRALGPTPETPIEHVPLSRRTRAACAALGVRSVGDLARVRRADVLRLHGVGVQTARQLQHLAQEAGLQLKPEGGR